MADRRRQNDFPPVASIPCPAWGVRKTSTPYLRLRVARFRKQQTIKALRKKIYYLEEKNRALQRLVSCQP